MGGGAPATNLNGRSPPHTEQVPPPSTRDRNKKKFRQCFKRTFKRVCMRRLFFAVFDFTLKYVGIHLKHL